LERRGDLPGTLPLTALGSARPRVTSWFPMKAIDPMARDQKNKAERFYFHRAQLVVLALAFAATAVIVFFLGIINGKALISRRINEPPTPVAKIPAPPRTQPDSPPAAQPEERRASRDTATKDKVATDVKAQEKSAKAGITKTQPVKETGKTAPKAPEKSGEKAGPPRSPQAERKSETARTALPDRIWTVQVKSSPDKIFAERWVAQLKGKGYDAFVVEAEVNGKTWHRIHVGRLATRQEAESLRSTLESKEKLSGTFPLQTTK
jgi:cell division septation protein DedD